MPSSTDAATCRNKSPHSTSSLVLYHFLLLSSLDISSIALLLPLQLFTPLPFLFLSEWFFSFLITPSPPPFLPPSASFLSSFSHFFAGLSYLYLLSSFSSLCSLQPRPSPPLSSPSVVSFIVRELFPPYIPPGCRTWFS